MLLWLNFRLILRICTSPFAALQHNVKNFESIIG